MSEEGNSDESQSPSPNNRVPNRVSRKDRPVTDNPDVHLDAPQLKVEELNLNLLNILNVEVKGLETELLLEVDLQNLVGLLKRVVDALERGIDALEDGEDSASDVIEALGRTIRAATGGSYSGSSSASGDSGGDGGGDGGGSSARQALESVKNALDSYDDYDDGSSGTSDKGEQNTRYEVDDNGDITRLTLNESGEVMEEEIMGNVSELSGESG